LAKVLRFFPVPLASIAGPMNPRPPARETATAKAGPADMDIGALARRGFLTQGKLLDGILIKYRVYNLVRVFWDT